MKKSKIVSYTSDELDQLPDESDWEANASMTNEEILAAIADDPDDAELVEWNPRRPNQPTEERIDLFVAVYDSQGRLAMRRISKVVSDSNKKRDYVRVVDDTGRSYRVPLQATEDVEQQSK